jgi:thioredoxin reductase
MQQYDAIVVGGGPAGMSAALWLGRYRRKVLVFDSDDPRNAETWAVHGYFGLPDPSPEQLRRRGRQQARAAGARVVRGTVRAIEGEQDAFRVTLTSGKSYGARRVLLATGLRDIKPEVPGFDDFYGSSIWHCPDCDGPAATGRRIGVIGWGTGIAKYCLYMLTWTDQVVLFTHSQSAGMSSEAFEALEHHGISIRREAIVRLEGKEGLVERVVLSEGPDEPVEAMFFHIASGAGSNLAAELGCALVPDHAVEGILEVDTAFQTSVPGIYAAGDITPGTRLAIRAASEGVRAAMGIHQSLIPDDRRL